MTVPAQTPNIGLNFGWETGDDDWGGPVNWNWLLLDVVSVPFAKSITLTVPPASPEEGDRYIIPVGATGVWANKVGRIAYFANDQWLYFQPNKGWYQRVFDTHKTYVWNGLEWEYYLDSITPEMMAQINAAVAAGEAAVEAAGSTAADRDAVHQDRVAVDAARQAVDANAAQVASDKSATVSAKNTAVAAANDAAASKQSSSENAVIASQKAQEAAASAGSASTSATAASTASGQATAAKVALFNRYYGGLTSDPATRPDGTPSQEGDEYFNTVDDKRKVYTSTGWVWDGGVRENDLSTGDKLVEPPAWADVPSAVGGGTVSDVMDLQARALLANIFADRKARAVNILRFLGPNYDGTTNAYAKAVEAWEYCLAYGLDLYMPALPGGAEYQITSENNFPFGRINGLPPTELMDCKDITIFGDGPATVLKTNTVGGADVLQTNGAKNLHYRNLRLRAAISGSDAGSNGISLTGGYDNVTAEWIWIDPMPFVDKGSYIDGGKAVSVQTPVAGQTVKCGTFRARNIFARGCVYGAGVEQDLLAASTMPTSIDIEITAENCREAVVVSAGAASGAIPANWNSGIRIRATAINCMKDVVVSRGHGVDIECHVVTTKTAAQRILSPTGGKWFSSDTVADVVGLECGYAKNSHIRVTGNKGDCQYKARVGGSSAGASGLGGATDRSTIIVDLAGAAAIEDFGAIDNGGNVTSNCQIYAIGRTAAPNIAHYLPSRANAITVGNAELVNDLLVQGSIKFTYTDGKTSYAEIGYDDESVTIKQTVGSSAGIRPLRVLNHAGGTILAVRNDGGLTLAKQVATSVATINGVIPVYDAANNLVGYVPMYQSYT